MTKPSAQSTRTRLLIAASLHFAAWMLLLPWDGYAQTAKTSRIGLLVHVAALGYVGLHVVRTPSARAVVLCMASLASTVLALGVALSNLYFWNGPP